MPTKGKTKAEIIFQAPGGTKGQGQKPKPPTPPKGRLVPGIPIPKNIPLWNREPETVHKIRMEPPPQEPVPQPLQKQQPVPKIRTAGGQGTSWSNQHHTVPVWSPLGQQKMSQKKGHLRWRNNQNLRQECSSKKLSHQPCQMAVSVSLPCQMAASQPG